MNLKALFIAVGNLCYALAGESKAKPSIDWAAQKNRLPNETERLLEQIERKGAVTTDTLANLSDVDGIARRVELLIFGGFVTSKGSILNISAEYQPFADQNRDDKTVVL